MTINPLLEELKKLKENDNPINLTLHFFLLADKMKPIYCDKKTLSKLTGLSERTIDERRRAGNIPYIQLSGTTDEKGGRKSIVFDPFEIMEYLNRNKKIWKKINYHFCFSRRSRFLLWSRSIQKIFPRSYSLCNTCNH